MKRFNFGTFLVDDANRRAFEVCRDISELAPISPQPVLLLGDEGCGKTHLLYSIVNRIRAGSSKTGLAYVTAYDFPDQVRALIDDPSPVERAQTAILLVDQLEALREWIEELEGVIRIFLDNHHSVVLASSVHHGRLHNLPKSFKELLDAGTIIHIVPRSSESQLDLIKRQVRTESDSLLAMKQQEVDELRSLLQRGGRGGELPDYSYDDGNVRMEAERTAKEELARKLEEAEQQAASLRDELDALRSQREEIAEQLEFARQETARARANGVAELESARSRMALELEEVRASHRQELQEALREAKDSIETAHELQRQLEEVRAGAKNHWQVAKDLQQQLGTVQNEVRDQAERATLLDRQLSESRQEAEAAQAEAQRLSSSLAEATKELEAFREERASLADEFAALRAQLEDASRSNESATRERDQLVERATILLQQVEERRAHISEVEEEHNRRIGELEQLLAHQAANAISPSEMESLQSELTDTKSALEEMGSARDTAVAALESTRAEAELLRSEQDRVRTELDSKQHELQENREELDRVRAEVDRLRSEAEQARADSVQLRAEAAAERSLLEEDKQRLVARLEDVESERDDLRARLQARERDCEEREHELDALRQEAAGQVAAANAQAGEIEGRMARLQNVYDALCRQHHKVADQLATAADVLTRLGSQLQTQEADPVEDRQLELTPAFFEGLASPSPFSGGTGSRSIEKLDIEAEAVVTDSDTKREPTLESIVSSSNLQLGQLDDYEMFEGDGEGDHSI
ncbi:MAG: DnaA/Hda family protein [Candidatus Hydrogenedentales bacterium]|jgi:chromosome segregation ATPase